MPSKTIKLLKWSQMQLIAKKIVICLQMKCQMESVVVILRLFRAIDGSFYETDRFMSPLNIFCTACLGLIRSQKIIYLKEITLFTACLHQLTVFKNNFFRSAEEIT